MRKNLIVLPTAAVPERKLKRHKKGAPRAQVFQFPDRRTPAQRAHTFIQSLNSGAA